MGRPLASASALAALLMSLCCTDAFIVPSPASLTMNAALAKRQQHQHRTRSGSGSSTPALSAATRPTTMLLNGWGSNPFSFQSPTATAASGQKRRADGLDTEVVICGTGIAGLALAADLERRGVDYLVVEKARYERSRLIGWLIVTVSSF